MNISNARYLFVFEKKNKKTNSENNNFYLTQAISELILNSKELYTFSQSKSTFYEFRIFPH